MLRVGVVLHRNGKFRRDHVRAVEQLDLHGVAPRHGALPNGLGHGKFGRGGMLQFDGAQRLLHPVDIPAHGAGARIALRAGEIHVAVCNVQIHRAVFRRERRDRVGLDRRDAGKPRVIVGLQRAV